MVRGQVLELGAAERRDHVSVDELGVVLVGGGFDGAFDGLFEPAVEVFADGGATRLEDQAGALLSPRFVALLDGFLLRLAVELTVL